MKNDYEIRGDVTAIFLKRNDGIVLETLMDTSDLPKVLNHPYSWRSRLDRKLNSFYVYGRKYENSKQIYVSLHRFIMNASKGTIVDHINHNTLDNRRSNLRVVTQSENMQNRRGVTSRNQSGYRGVYWDSSNNKWRACIRLKGKNIYLGLYNDVHEAGMIAKEAIANLMPFSQEALNR